MSEYEEQLSSPQTRIRYFHNENNKLVACIATKALQDGRIAVGLSRYNQSSKNKRHEACQRTAGRAWALNYLFLIENGLMGDDDFSKGKGFIVSRENLISFIQSNPFYEKGSFSIRSVAEYNPSRQ